MNNSTIKLFNKVLVDKQNSKFVLIPKIFKKFSYFVTQDVLDKLGEEKIYKLLSSATNLDKMNKTFFTFLKTVETSTEERIFHQILHYMSTYGYESIFGEQNEDVIYLPKKDIIEGDDTEETIAIRVLSGITKKDLKEKVRGVIFSNAGINTAHIAEWNIILEGIFSIEELKNVLNSEDVKNRDMLAQIANVMYPLYIPKDIELLIRLAIIRSGSPGIKVASKEVIQKLKDNYDNISLYAKEYGYTFAENEIAKVWRRNRKYFLAMKHNESIVGKRLINTARKKADRLYKKVLLHPVLNATEVDDVKSFEKALPYVTIPQLVRVYNAMLSRIKVNDIFFTRIRNGKTWIEKKEVKRPKNVLEFLALIQREFNRRAILDGIKVYIPKDIRYPVPSSMKDMVGAIPNFTTIDISKTDIAIGVHWYNNKGSVDLDLSFRNIEGPKIGWNSEWKNSDSIFSGDITNAPKKSGGASEFIVVKKNSGVYGTFSLNLYAPLLENLEKDYTYTLFINIPDDIEKVLEKKNDYLLKSGRTLFRSDVNMVKSESDIGYLLGSKFMVCNFAMKTSTVAGTNNGDILGWMMTNSSNKMSINEFIERSGGIITNNPDEASISLDPSKITVDTWNNLKVFN